MKRRDKDRGDNFAERHGRKLDKSPVFQTSDYRDHIQYESNCSLAWAGNGENKTDALKVSTRRN